MACLLLPCCLFLWHMSTRRHTRYEIYQSGIPFEGGLTVSAAGDRVYFSSPASRQGDIYFFSPESMSVDRFTGTAECDIMPVVAPDGSRLAYCREYLNHAEVMVVDVATGESRLLASDYPFNYPTAFTHDGQKLLVFQYASGTSRRNVLIDLEANHEVVLPNSSYIDIARSDPESIVGVTTHSDGLEWVAEWNLNGTLVRWITQGDRIEPVVDSPELLIKRGSQWHLASIDGERQLPITGERIFIAKVGDVVAFWSLSDNTLGSYNVATYALTVQDAPEARQSRVSGIAASEGLILFQLFNWNRREGGLHQFDLETCELVPLVNTDDARVIQPAPAPDESDGG